MKKKLCAAYILTGAACFAYYFLFSFATRFGLDMSWIWLVVGGALTLAGVIGRSEGIPRLIRIAWRILMCAGLALVIGLESLVISGMVGTPPAGLDYIIVLGAKVNASGPSRALQWRIDEAAEYLLENPETIAVASGGRGEDEHVSEAECIRQGLLKAGVAEERILVENKSATTAQNMEFSHRMIPEGASVGVVTNNFHVYRALLLAKNVGIENAAGIPTGYPGFSLLHYMMREGACLIADGLMGNL